jgi:hypothetical protein
VRDRTVAYFTKRLAHVRYAEFQAPGYPSAAGVPKAPTKSSSKRASRAVACTGRVLSLIR